MKSVEAEYRCSGCFRLYGTKKEAEACAASNACDHIQIGDYVFIGSSFPFVSGIKRVEAVGANLFTACADGHAQQGAGHIEDDKDSEHRTYVDLCACLVRRVGNDFIDKEVAGMRRCLAALEKLQKAIHEANARHEGGGDGR